MGKYFNIAGPCNPERHYMLSATARVPDVMRLIDDASYFVVHAQRQCGKKAMDLGVLFRGAKYAVECKKVAYYARSHEKAYDQVCGYMDTLGVNEGWLVVFDADLSKPWQDRIYAEDIPWKGKTVHLVGC